ncbi:hypothetical protein Nepgr_002129 [Nepenthes gracilis]|uniref:Uncharacterized protein n=1 Tax=Nepenthes gracilis TaxID=150966 RepID=A0AAD3RY97_NEPGR|nr:hypothetical protein Nepgr_002129 [Nepenthes gracilis]
MLSGSVEDNVRCSQSMISRIQGITMDIQKLTFKRDFPLLGTDKRPATAELRRFPLPGLNRGIQLLPIGNSALMTKEDWTSVLVEVLMGVGIAASSLPRTASTTSGLNMAEAFVQAPSQSHTASLPLMRIQQFEELAVFQSSRPIP